MTNLYYRTNQGPENKWELSILLFIYVCLHSELLLLNFKIFVVIRLCVCSTKPASSCR